MATVDENGDPVLVLDEGDNAWMMTATALVLLMTPALAFFYGGLVDRKNILNQLFLSFICMGIVLVQWVLIGFSFAFGPPTSKGFGSFGDAALTFGQRLDPIYSPTYPLLTFAAYQGTFAIITPALISGPILSLSPHPRLIHRPTRRFRCHRRTNEIDSLHDLHLHLDDGLLRSDGPLGVGREWLVERIGCTRLRWWHGCAHSLRHFGLRGFADSRQTFGLSTRIEKRHEHSLYRSRHVSPVGRMDGFQCWIGWFSQVCSPSRYPSSSDELSLLYVVDWPRWH